MDCKSIFLGVELAPALVLGQVSYSRVSEFVGANAYTQDINGNPALDAGGNAIVDSQSFSDSQLSWSKARAPACSTIRSFQATSPR